MSDVTQLLHAIESGRNHAAEELLPLVYEELRRLASGRIARELPGQTLQATALVHEAWLRLVDSPKQQWQGRAHFFSAAAEAMRRIMIDRARAKKAEKRGGGQQVLKLDDITVAESTPSDELLAINEALDRFQEINPEAAELLKLRFFIGLKNVEAAATMGISERTAKRHWAFARAWLFNELKPK
jgi:RNA polymerase sigma factor (TIGR02999 family)